MTTNDSVELRPDKKLVLATMRNRIEPHKLRAYSKNPKNTWKSIDAYPECKGCPLLNVDMWSARDGAIMATTPRPPHTVGNCFAILDHVCTDRKSYDNVLTKVPAALLLKAASAVYRDCLILAKPAKKPKR